MIGNKVNLSHTDLDALSCDIVLKKYSTKALEYPRIRKLYYINKHYLYRDTPKIKH